MKSEQRTVKSEMIDSNGELDRLMEMIRAKYDVETVPMKIGSKILHILQIKDFEIYIQDLIEHKGAKFEEIPFWAKIWDSSLLLAFFLGRQPVVLGQRMLEIGAGMGLVGIYAALCGHRVTISDINEDALLFCQANALINGATGIEVRMLDWNAPELNLTFDVIVGSEVVYERQSYPALVQFLRRTLSPSGMIFLAKNTELHTPMFFSELTKHFEFKENVQQVRVSDEPVKIALYAIRPKRASAASSKGK